MIRCQLPPQEKAPKPYAPRIKSPQTKAPGAFYGEHIFGGQLELHHIGMSQASGLLALDD